MHKLPVLLAASCGIAAITSYAQNTYPYPSTGSLGIGTTSPQDKLDVIGNVRSTGFVYSSADGAPWWISGLGNGPAILLQKNSAASGTSARRGSLGWVDNNNNKSELLTWSQDSGNVGIGTTNPKGKFAVSFNNDDEVVVYSPGDNIIGIQTTLDGQVLSNNGGSNATLQLEPMGGNVSLAAGGGSVLIGKGGILIGSGNTGSGNNTYLNITQTAATNGAIQFDAFVSGVGGGNLLLNSHYTGGNVGIGTTNPTQKLSVNGTILAKEIIVQTALADYVFDPAYHLLALSEVEARIKAEKHLPGIPSAVEAGERGVSLGEMQAKLLAKIEELTLHQIEQEKELGALRTKVATLESAKVRSE